MTDDPKLSRRRFFRAALDNLREGIADVVGQQLPDMARQVGRAASGGGGDAHLLPRPRTVVRPPGAQPEEHDFLETCERCRACVDACPEYCIIPSQPGMAAELGTPYLLPEEAPCTFCHDCVDACPTGALLPFEKETVKIGTAVIEKLHCIVSSGEECDLCVQACPKTGVAIKIDEDRFPLVSMPDCTGCGFCGPVCPAPARAITIFPIAPVV